MIFRGLALDSISRYLGQSLVPLLLYCMDLGDKTVGGLLLFCGALLTGTAIDHRRHVHLLDKLS